MYVIPHISNRILDFFSGLPTHSFTRVISVRLSKNLAKDGTLAKSARFTLYIYFAINSIT